jgi:DNA repair exonuclease SbcCD ATPase subunit
MAGDYDASEFVDSDFQAHKAPRSPGATPDPYRAPTREDVDRQVVEAQQKLVELKRAQDELERERAALEDLRRRQTEFQNGRQEMIQNLTRGLGLLEAAEFNARRDAGQMAKTIEEFRDAMNKLQAVNEESWTKDNFNVELTRGLTVIENSRMEWNSARLKLPVLSGEAMQQAEADKAGAEASHSPLADIDFLDLCKLGLAITWPLALILLAAVVFLALQLAHR